MSFIGYRLSWWESFKNTPSGPLMEPLKVPRTSLGSLSTPPPFLQLCRDSPRECLSSLLTLPFVVSHTPVKSNTISQFSLQDLATRMGDVLTNVTGVNTTITVTYKEGSDTDPISDPGSFTFGITLEKDFETPEISFSKTLDLGDFASISVEDADFFIGGGFSLSTEFGVVFAPDQSESLKLVGSLRNESCINDINFIIKYTTDEVVEDNTTIELASIDCSSVDTLLNSLKSAFGASVIKDDVSVDRVGTNSFCIAFNESYSYVEVIELDEFAGNLTTLFGLRNGDQDKQSGFQFANGLFDLIAEIEISGDATIAANIGDVIEVSSDIGANLFGSVELSAGKAGQLIPVSDWLAMLIAVKDETSEFYDPEFASASLSFDGSFNADVTVDAFGGLSLAGIEGGFNETFTLDLLNLTALNETSPNIVFEVDIPSIGDLRNLSFKDVINLLQIALEFLVGPDEGDTVGSCTGGLLGTEIFGEPVSINDFALHFYIGYLRVDPTNNFQPQGVYAQASCDWHIRVRHRGFSPSGGRCCGHVSQ